MRNTLLISGVLVMVLFGCDRSRPDSEIIVRVDDAALTMEMLERAMPRELKDDLSRQQHIEYVKNWVDKEILYQEALRRGMHKDEAISSRIRHMKKELLCAELLDRFIRQSDITITEDRIRRYYKTHKDEFVYNANVYKYMELVVEDVKTAWSVRKRLTDANFSSIARKVSTRHVPAADSIPYRSVQQMPAALAEVVPRIRVNGITSPVETGYGYSIIMILGRKNKGDPRPYHEVRDRIVQVLFVQEKQKRKDDIIADLRQKMEVEIHLESLPRRSTRQSEPKGDSAEAEL